MKKVGVVLLLLGIIAGMLWLLAYLAFFTMLLVIVMVMVMCILCGIIKSGSKTT